MKRINQFLATTSVFVLSVAQAIAGGSSHGGGGSSGGGTHTGCHGGFCNGHAVPEIDGSQALLAISVVVCAMLILREMSRKAFENSR